MLLSALLPFFASALLSADTVTAVLSTQSRIDVGIPASYAVTVTNGASGESIYTIVVTPPRAGADYAIANASGAGLSCSKAANIVCTGNVSDGSSATIGFYATAKPAASVSGDRNEQWSVNVTGSNSTKLFFNGSSIAANVYPPALSLVGRLSSTGAAVTTYRASVDQAFNLSVVLSNTGNGAAQGVTISVAPANTTICTVTQPTGTPTTLNASPKESNSTEWVLTTKSTGACLVFLNGTDSVAGTNVSNGQVTLSVQPPGAFEINATALTGEPVAAGRHFTIIARIKNTGSSALLQPAATFTAPDAFCLSLESSETAKKNLENLAPHSSSSVVWQVRSQAAKLCSYSIGLEGINADDAKKITATQTVAINVSNALEVEVSADKRNYIRGETGKFTVKIFEPNGIAAGLQKPLVKLRDIRGNETVLEAVEIQGFYQTAYSFSENNSIGTYIVTATVNDSYGNHGTGTTSIVLYGNYLVDIVTPTRLQTMVSGTSLNLQVSVKNFNNESIKDAQITAQMGNSSTSLVYNEEFNGYVGTLFVPNVLGIQEVVFKMASKGNVAAESVPVIVTGCTAELVEAKPVSAGKIAVKIRARNEKQDSCLLLSKQDFKIFVAGKETEFEYSQQNDLYTLAYSLASGNTYQPQAVEARVSSAGLDETFQAMTEPFLSVDLANRHIFLGQKYSGSVVGRDASGKPVQGIKITVEKINVLTKKSELIASGETDVAGAMAFEFLPQEQGEMVQIAATTADGFQLPEVRVPATKNPVPEPKQFYEEDWFKIVAGLALVGAGFFGYNKFAEQKKNKEEEIRREKIDAERRESETIESQVRSRRALFATKPEPGKKRPGMP